MKRNINIVIARLNREIEELRLVQSALTSLFDELKDDVWWEQNSGNIGLDDEYPYCDYVDAIQRSNDNIRLANKRLIKARNWFTHNYQDDRHHY